MSTFVKAWDNGGETLDRYTIIFDDEDGFYCVGSSDDPHNPQGFWQHTDFSFDISSDDLGEIGVVIDYLDLPDDVKTAISNEEK